MKNYKLVLSFLFLFIICHLSAESVDQIKARQVAQNFISSHTSSLLRNSMDLQLVYTAMEKDTITGLRSFSGNTLFYIYNVANNNGFVIVSGDDNINPILGYSDKGYFKIERMPSNLDNWLSFYKQEIIYALKSDYSASNEIKQQWNSLLNGTISTKAENVLFPTALWDQTEPYNNLCPKDSGKISLAGCVATSMGIIMKYYQWPLQGKGSNSYKTYTKKTSISADFNVSYNWNNMLDVYANNNGGSPNWNNLQAQAVSTLIYHAGVASYMDYGLKESGANQWNAVHAFINNFSYDKGMYLAYRNLYTINEWNSLIRKELDEGRLVFYGGSAKNGVGHQFVIDGYDPENYFHVNWGWSGIGNGYYLLSSLAPIEQGTSLIDDESGFTIEQDAVIGLQKAKRGSLVNHEFYFIEEDDFDIYGLSTDVDTIISNKPFNVYHSYVCDYGYRAFNGIWGFFIVDKNGNRKTSLNEFRFDLDADDMMYNTKGFPLVITSKVEKGDKIRLFYSSDGQTWKPVRGTANTITELPIGEKVLTTNENTILQQNINVFPTKATSVIYIQPPTGLSIQKVCLYDLTGHLVKDIKINSLEANLSIMIDDIAPGIYIVAVQTPGQISRYKIIKQ